MKKSLFLLPLALFSFSAHAGWYCVASPQGYTSRLPRLPGYGHQPTLPAAKARAIWDCKMRNQWARSCVLNGCSPE